MTALPASSQREILAIEELAESLRAKAGIDPLKLPLDPLLLAEALGVGVHPVGFFRGREESETLLLTLAPHMSPPLEGLQPSPGGTLLVNARLEPFRRRMAVAHGLAHLVLGHLKATPSRQDWVGGKALPEDPEIERQANLLATALLMPEEPFRQAWRAMGRLGVHAMAPLFGVPPNAVVFRGWALDLEVPLP